VARRLVDRGRHSILILQPLVQASALKSGDNSCSSHYAHAGGIALLSVGGWPLWGPQVGRWIHSRRSRSSMLRRHSYYPLALLDFLVSFFLLYPIFWNDCVDEFALKLPGIDLVWNRLAFTIHNGPNGLQPLRFVVVAPRRHHPCPLFHLKPNGMRPPKSVKRRASKACQCCRSRKVRCNVVEHGAPCTNCRLDEVECIVSESKRKKLVDIQSVSRQHSV
jgi:hypothetical protein